MSIYPDDVTVVISEAPGSLLWNYSELEIFIPLLVAFLSATRTRISGSFNKTGLCVLPQVPEDHYSEYS